MAYDLASRNPAGARVFATSLNFVLATILSAAVCSACTHFYPLVQVGPSFRVRVVDRGRPVTGLRLEINDRRVVTDADGIALFADMQPGLFSVSLEHHSDFQESVNLQVSPNGPANVTVPLIWPTTPILLRSLKGTLHAPGYLPGQPEPRLSLDLMEGISGRVVGSGHSDSNGEFNFPDAPPRLYFLRVNPSGLKDWAGNQITGMIAVALESSAQADGLDLELGWSSCGLSYQDRSKCSQGELRAEQICGRVFLPDGAVVSDVEILLFAGEKPKLIERMRSDERGRFASHVAEPGTYEMVIGSPGFNSLHGTVSLQPSGELGCREPINVHLNPQGACSGADVH